MSVYPLCAAEVNLLVSAVHPVVAQQLIKREEKLSRRREIVMGGETNSKLSFLICSSYKILYGRVLS